MKILHYLLFASLLLTLHSCKQKPDGTIELNQPFTMKMGNSFLCKEGMASLFSINSIVEDSRCPTGLNCLRAGEVKVEVKLESKNNKDIFMLNLEEGKSNRVPLQGTDAYFQLKEVKPHPVDGQEIKDADYEITFVLVKN